MSWSLKFSASTAHIADTYLAKNVAQNKETDLEFEKVGSTFHPNDGVLYLIVTMAGIVSEVKIIARWIAIDAGGVKNQLIDEGSWTTDNKEPFFFDLSLPRPWPVGTYKIDLLLEEKIAKTINFDVAAE